METKSWYMSRTIWSTVISVLSFVLGNFLKVPADQVTTLTDQLQQHGPDFIGVVASICAIIFRMKATKTVGSN